MQIALEASRNGILAMVDKQDLIANNLANLNTTAFKRVSLAQADFTIPGTQVSATPPDFTQGDVTSTGNDMDLAIEGDGFFTVLRGGVPAYTRAGSFHRDRDGNLVTAQGYPVDPPISFPAETERVEVGQDGTVYAVLDNGATTATLGRLDAVRFQNPQGLLPAGDNLYLEGPDSGPALTGAFGDQGFPIVRQRSLEDSNVDLSRELTDELIAQRGFQANVRAFKTTDDLIGNTLDLFR
jgi:flagellar basal-body rod protein FlgG